MYSATNSKYRSFLEFVVLLLIAVSRLFSQAADSVSPAAAEQVPFTIEHADHFFQRNAPSGESRFILQGNVRVKRGPSGIDCGSLTYFPAERYFLCLDSVHVIDPQRSLSSDSLFYYLDSARYLALGHLWWTAENFTGTGWRGEYFRDKEIMVVNGEAEASDSLRRITADRLEYDYLSQVLRATGTVQLVELKSGSKALAASGSYDRNTGQVVLAGRPVVTYYDRSDSLSPRTYHLSCDLLRGYGRDSLCALGRVHLWEDSLSITADSLFYDRQTGTSYFRGGQPVVENPSYKLSGALLDMVASGRSLEKVTAVRGSRGEFYFSRKAGADSTAHPDSLKRDVGSWIEGDSLELFFGHGALDSLAASGTARSYFRKNSESGINYLQGSRILLIWQEKALDRVEVSRGGRGLYLSPDTLAGMHRSPDSSGFEKPRPRSSKKTRP